MSVTVFCDLAAGLSFCATAVDDVDLRATRGFGVGTGSGCASCGAASAAPGLNARVKRSHALSPLPDSLIGDDAIWTCAEPLSSSEPFGGLTLLPMSPGCAPTTF